MKKKENVKENKKVVNKDEKKENKVLNALKKFFNHPAPLFVVFIVIIIILLLFINKNTKTSKIYIGSIQEDTFVLSNVHYFSNSDMNYFFAGTPVYTGEDADKKVYAFQVGYFVVDKDGNYIELATRSNKLEKASDVKTLIDEMSNWDFADSSVNPFRFTTKVVSNLENLHYVFKGSTVKDNDNADVYIDYPVKLDKITK